MLLLFCLLAVLTVYCYRSGHMEHGYPKSAILVVALPVERVAALLALLPLSRMPFALVGVSLAMVAHAGFVTCLRFCGLSCVVWSAILRHRAV